MNMKFNNERKQFNVSTATKKKNFLLKCQFNIRTLCISLSLVQFFSTFWEEVTKSRCTIWATFYTPKSSKSSFQKMIVSKLSDVTFKQSS